MLICLMSFLFIQGVINGEVFLGNIHIAAAPALGMDKLGVDDCQALAEEVQTRQKELVTITDYHMLAATEILDLPIGTVREAFRQMSNDMVAGDIAMHKKLDLPNDKTELWTVLLQSSHVLGSLVKSDLPAWSSWLSSTLPSDEKLKNYGSQEVCLLRETLKRHFWDAENVVRAAISELDSNRYYNPSPEHILQVACRKTQQAPLILRAAMTIIQTGTKEDTKLSACVQESAEEDIKPFERTLALPFHQHILPSQERLGYWGFHDTSFVLNTDSYLQPFVSIRGNRYSNENKRYYKLIPFIENAIGLTIDPSSEFNLAFDVSRCRKSQSALGKLGMDRIASVCCTVSDTIEDRTRHGAGHSLSDILRIRHSNKMRIPDAVVWPSDADEVSALVSLASKQNWCLIPYGGGTSVSGAVCCPTLDEEPRPIISVDMTKLNKILVVDAENGLAHTEAGIRGSELIQKLSQQGFTVGHEPDSLEFSTLGGWIATKSSGMKRNKYGNIEDIVTAIEVVGADGVMKKHGHWGRESCGLDLASLFFGSEGCLGIILSAVVRIHPLPEIVDHDALMLKDFQTGLRFLKDLNRLKSDIPASCRLLDNGHFQLGQALQAECVSLSEQLKKKVASLFLHRWGCSTEVVCIAVAYEGTKFEVKEQKRLIAVLAKSYSAASLGSEMGRASFQMTFMIAYLRDFALSYQIAGESFETFANWSDVWNIICSTKDTICEEHAKMSLPGRPFLCCRVTQLYSDGVCLYFFLCTSFVGTKGEDCISRFSRLENLARSEILARGGSLSHHHGVGKVRRKFLQNIHSEASHRAIGSIKHALDPNNIFGAQNGGFAFGPL